MVTWSYDSACRARQNMKAESMPGRKALHLTVAGNDFEKNTQLKSATSVADMLQRVPTL